jgi:hypothetical protein
MRQPNERCLFLTVSFICAGKRQRGFVFGLGAAARTRAWFRPPSFSGHFLEKGTFTGF